MRVALACRVLDAAQRAGREREQQDVTERDEPEQSEHAERARGERLADARQHEQAMAREAIGQRAGRQADEEHRERAHSHRDAHQHGRVRQLEGEPAEDDDLAHHADRVQEDRRPETAKVGEAEERELEDERVSRPASRSVVPRRRRA